MLRPAGVLGSRTKRAAGWRHVGEQIVKKFVFERKTVETKCGKKYLWPTNHGKSVLAQKIAGAKRLFGKKLSG